MGTYRITREAKNNLRDIWLYGLKKYGAKQADNYYNALFDRFEEIAENPYQYQAVDEICEGYRRNPCGADAMYYRINGSVVEIVVIIGRQEFENFL